MRAQQLALLRRFVPAAGALGDDRQQARHGPDQLEQQRPGLRVQPLDVLDEQQPRLALGPPPHHVAEELDQPIGAGVTGQRGGGRRLGQRLGEERIEQRQERAALRVAADRGNESRLVPGVGQQSGEHRTPRVVRGAPFDRLGEHGEDLDAGLGGALRGARRQRRLTDALLTFDEHRRAAAVAAQPLDRALHQLAFAPAPDQRAFRQGCRTQRDQPLPPHRLGAVLERQHRTPLDLEAERGSLDRRLIDQHLAYRHRAQPRRDVDRVAEQRVLPTLGRPEDPAADPPRADARATTEPEIAQCGLELRRGP